MTGHERPVGEEHTDPQEQSSATALVERFAMGKATSADEARWQGVCQAYLRDGGELPFERYLKLHSPMKQRAEKRDAELRKAAAKLSPVLSERMRSKMLLGLWEKFVREIYPAWVAEGEPPADADHLNVALFHATRHSRGEDAMSYVTVRRALAQLCD